MAASDWASPNLAPLQRAPHFENWEVLKCIQIPTHPEVSTAAACILTAARRRPPDAYGVMTTLSRVSAPNLHHFNKTPRSLHMQQPAGFPRKFRSYLRCVRCPSLGPHPRPVRPEAGNPLSLPTNDKVTQLLREKKT